MGLDWNMKQGLIIGCFGVWHGLEKMGLELSLKIKNRLIAKDRKLRIKGLKAYLSLNSIFSAISGIAMLIFPERLRQLFNIDDAYVFPIIGACLLLFAVFVWFVASPKLANKTLVQIITFLDILWVIGSF